MKSDEILANWLCPIAVHCPMEDKLSPLDNFPCDDYAGASKCIKCVLDWARKEAEEQEEQKHQKEK